MTIAVVLLLGAGSLLLVSAIENVSIADTFHNIMQGAPLNTNARVNTTSYTSGGSQSNGSGTTLV